MQRTITVLVVFIMLLVALALCVRQTVVQMDLMSSTAVALLGVQAMLGGGIIAAGAWLIRRRITR